MSAIDLTTQRVVLTKTSAPKKPGAIVKPQILLATLLQSLGFASLTIGPTAPLDQETLWYNSDNNTFRRYNPLTSTWAIMTPPQWVLHMLQVGMKAAAVEGVVDDADKFPFFDVSANEMKMISSEDYKASLGVTGWVQWGPTITLGAAQSVVNLQDLPERFTSVLFIADYTGVEISPTTKTPRVGVRGVYPTGATFNLSPAIAGIIENTPVVLAEQLSGDRNDLTRFINMDWVANTFRTTWETEGNWASAPVAASLPYRIPTTQRLKSIRLLITDDPVSEGGNPLPTYGFAPGSTFKQFVR